MGGQEFSSYGVFHEVTHDRIVKTMEFGGYPGHVALETIRFEALPGNKTRLVTQSVFQSVTDRDGVVKSGFEKGAGESHDQLSELLVELKTT
jgi:uncharacterized protein YndB with AHSA1/START domain